MNIPHINTILSRNEISDKIKTFLQEFESNKNDLTRKRGLYIYGHPGCGKTTFVKNVLKELNYDSLLYDAGDIRNKLVIETITKHNMADRNIMSMFTAKKQYIAIIMDEIDGMNNGDKGGINTLIKLIRPKKTKKQKKEDTTNSPIICISNYHADKKIKELMKVCDVYELCGITVPQTLTIVKEIMPKIDDACQQYISSHLQGDLRRITLIFNIYTRSNGVLGKDIMNTILFPKTYNDDTKQITHNMFSHPYDICDHGTIMNETDRTIVGLLWHENVIDLLDKMENRSEAVDLYIRLLDNICFADYIDRITFQKQIWQFNELSSLIKTFYNSMILHESFVGGKVPSSSVPTDIRFTKVLTKYSTEYNNSLFVQHLCQQIGMDKKDMFVFFKSLCSNNNDTQLSILYDTYDITKLDINRISRYLDKHTMTNAASSSSNEDITCESIDINCVGIEEYHNIDAL